MGHVSRSSRGQLEPVQRRGMMAAPDPGTEPKRGNCREEVAKLDAAVYAAIAATPTPVLDEVMRRVSRAADASRLWLCSAALLAVAGGPTGRGAAAHGVASTAVTSALVNLVF